MDDEELLNSQADELLGGMDDDLDMNLDDDLGGGSNDGNDDAPQDDFAGEYPGDKIEIIPALMPQSEKGISGAAEMFSELVKTVQLDIMDGVFVPETTWPYEKGSDEVAVPPEILDGPLQFEIDLMVARPENELIKWSTAGATRLIAHIESIEDFDRFWEEADWVRMGAIDKQIEIGLALDIETPNTDLDPYIDKIDFIQCMGIAKIGYQGEAFDERVLEKISDLRQHYPDTIISVDGGVNLETAGRLKEAGATRLVSGSAILNSKDKREVIQMLKTM